MRQSRISLASLARKWSRALEKGKGLRLEGDELDVLNAVGVGARIAEIAAAEQRDEAQRRLAERQPSAP